MPTKNTIRRNLGDSHRQPKRETPKELLGCTRLSTEGFVERAIAVHGNQYDYSKAKYAGRHAKLNIICPKCGMFTQEAGSHLSGHGCPMCCRITTAVFKRRAEQVHDNKYDYTKTEYTGSLDKVEIVCREHGTFQQIASEHLRGSGCMKCGGNYHLATADIIRRAKDVHGERYDYTKTEYVNKRVKLNIICPKHGLFYQGTREHLRGSGCPECANEIESQRRRKTQEEFLAGARTVHGDRYDYSAVAYEHTLLKVEIICCRHGVFSQRAGDHLNGSGCPRCNESQGERDIAKTLARLHDKGVVHDWTRQASRDDIHDKSRLYFDFMVTFVDDTFGYIEYNGYQHYHAAPWFTCRDGTSADEQLVTTKRRDMIKRTRCRELGIPLLEIPYWNFGHIIRVLRAWCFSRGRRRLIQSKGVVI